MKQVFITKLGINKVRHLKNIGIHLSKQSMKHLIITGKNGSGKTSLLDAMAIFLNVITQPNDIRNAMQFLNNYQRNVRVNNITDYVITDNMFPVETCKMRTEQSLAGVILEMNQPLENIRFLFEKGEFVVAYYRANRIFNAQIPKHVEKVELKNEYAIDEAPREEFIKYLLDLKMTQALALSNGKNEKANEIKVWYENFQGLLKKIFVDDTLRLEFDEETFEFNICIDGREPFNFNTLSSGYAAVLDIVVDLIIRMEKQSSRKFDFSAPGVVLIDEIETHLHLELQKNILELLTTLFPNIQFIVSTHSPFVLNTLENVIIYDLEKHILVENGLTDVPYSGIVEGYFNADTMSAILRKKYEEYKKLVKKPELTDDDFEEIAELQMYLDEIPDYLALDLTTEYQRMKIELESRGDI